MLLACNLFEFTAAKIVEHAVNLQASLAHRVNDGRDALQCLHARLNVLLREEDALLFAVHARQLVGELLAQHAQWLKPDIQDVELRVGERGRDTAAGCVPAHDDVLDLHVEDGILHDGEHADVGAVDDVGDVAVREHLAGLEAKDGGLGDARVGAA